MRQKVITAIQNKHFLSLAGNGIMSFLGMITAAVIYRYLPLAEAGKWIFFTSTLVLVDTFRSGFITTAFIKFYAGAPDERTAEIAGSTWFIGIVITLVFILINIPLLLFTNHIKDEGFSLFLNWFGLAYICSLPAFMTTCVLQGEQRFDRMLYVRAINQGGFITFVVGLVIAHKLSLHTVLYAYLTANFITSAYTLIRGWSRITSFNKRSRLGILEMYNFGKYSVGTTLSSNMFGTSDTYIINFMLGPAALAVYNLGQSLMQLVEIPLRSFAATGMPMLSAAFNKDNRDEVIYTMKKFAGMLTVILVPAVIVAVLMANFAIALIGGGKYVHTEAANVFRLFMTFALLYPADRFFALTLDVIHRPQVNFYKVLVMLAANITFDFIGIYIFGNVYGIAITTVVPTLIAVSIGFWALNKYQKFSFLDVYAVGWKETKNLITFALKKNNKAL